MKIALYGGWYLGGADSVDRCFVVIGTENTRTRYDRVGAGGDNDVGVGRLDAAVDLNPGVETFLVCHFSDGLNLRYYGIDESLTAETRVLYAPKMYNC